MSFANDHSPIRIAACPNGQALLACQRCCPSQRKFRVRKCVRESRDLHDGLRKDLDAHVLQLLRRELCHLLSGDGGAGVPSLTFPCRKRVRSVALTRARLRAWVSTREGNRKRRLLPFSRSTARREDSGRSFSLFLWNRVVIGHFLQGESLAQTTRCAVSTKHVWPTRGQKGGVAPRRGSRQVRQPVRGIQMGCHLNFGA